MRRLHYDKIEKFDKYIRDLKLRGFSFEYHKTNYTSRIKFGNSSSVIFNKDGVGDNRVLNLISAVRNDANDFLEKGNKIGSGNITWFDLLELPNENERLIKIDIKAAYWTAAQKHGVIRPMTNRLFDKLYKDDSIKEKKIARLKALGSLATKKIIRVFKSGKLIDEYVVVEDTKELYLDICRLIDTIITQCTREIPGCVYTYWDCIFIRPEYKQSAIDFFGDNGYSVGIEESKLKYFPFEMGGQLQDTVSNKGYMVRNNNAIILNSIRHE